MTGNPRNDGDRLAASPEEPDPGRPGFAKRLASRMVPGIQTVAAQVEPYAERWRQRNDRALATDGPLWVALGDSMSQGIGAADFEDGWINLAAATLAREGRAYRIVNLSRTGATAADVVRHQLPELARLPVKPALVTLLVGANDVFARRRRRGLRSQFEQLLPELPSCSVVAHLPQPIKLARDVNALIDAQATRTGIVPVNLRPAARQWRGHRAPDLFHPNGRGYARIAALFAEAAMRVPYHSRIE